MQVFDDLRKVLLGLLVQVGNSDTRSEDGVVRMLCSQIGSGLRCEVLQDYEHACFKLIKFYVHRARRLSRLGKHQR